MAHFNTTHNYGDDLKNLRDKATRQDNVVLSYFDVVSFASPSQVHRALIDGHQLDTQTPLTSIRRSITTLTTKGLLQRTDRKVEGVYGREEYVWCKKDAQPKQLRLV
jgi:hypothetical protein